MLAAAITNRATLVPIAASGFPVVPSATKIATTATAGNSRSIAMIHHACRGGGVTSNVRVCEDFIDQRALIQPATSATSA